jgi:hypothetical protein
MPGRPLTLIAFMMSALLMPALGSAGTSDWMDAQLGLAPLKFDPSGQVRKGYLHSFSNAPDTQTYAGAAGGGDEPLDLEALSKKWTIRSAICGSSLYKTTPSSYLTTFR